MINDHKKENAEIVQNNLNNPNIINQKFFNLLDKYKLEQTKEAKENLISYANENYETLDPVSQQEQQILENYHVIMANSLEKDLKQTNRLYIEEVINMELSQHVENRIVNVLNFDHDLLVYLKFGETPVSNSKRSCLDQCMFDALYDLYYMGNEVDHVLFLVSEAEATAGMAASCAWDCW